MTQAETELHWRSTDMTVPARLTALAASVRAAYLIIGTVDALDSRETIGSQNPVYRAYATVHAQVLTVMPPHFSAAAVSSRNWISEPGYRRTYGSRRRS